MSAHTDPAVLALVRGVLWPGFFGYVAPDWLKRELDGGLAGVVLFAQNIDESDDRQLPALTGVLSSLGQNTLIGIDEEGGTVTRLESARGSTLPGHAQLGAVDDESLTRATGTELARRVGAAGVNVALAPDADVNTEPRNPVIGVRSFGSDPQLVARHVAAMVDGIQTAGVVACAKHYPGHGDTSADSHIDLPRSNSDWDRMLREHLPPFDAAIAVGVKAIMTAHILVPGAGSLPATLNPTLLGSLRERGFTGTIVTDALDMAAIRGTVGSGPGAVQALLAGSHLLCIGNPANPGNTAAVSSAGSDADAYVEVRRAICDAIDDGTLPLAVLERAAANVSDLGRWSAARADDRRAAAASPGFDADAIVSAALRTSTDLPQLTGAVQVLDLRHRATIAVATETDVFTAALAVGGAAESIRLPPSGDGAFAETAGTAASSAPGGLVVLVDRIGVTGAQTAAIDAIRGIRPDAVIVNVGMRAPDAPTRLSPIIETLGDSLTSATVVARLLGAGGVA
ncbi:MAG: glycoside hydrolase family 3 N-terminal domain-containing protein [Mycetocola sp.]